MVAVGPDCAEHRSLPFDGSHGWYWQNRGTEPVTVDIQVAGYQEKLYRP